MKYDGEKIHRMKEELSRALGQNESLRKVCKQQETKLRDYEIDEERERTNRNRISNMRIRQR